MKRSACVLVLLVLAAPSTAGELTRSSWKQVFDDVVPDASDCRWQAVGWRPTLWDAVIEANAEEKPILLWAMNGHALACT